MYISIKIHKYVDTHICIDIKIYNHTQHAFKYMSYGIGVFFKLKPLATDTVGQSRHNLQITKC